MDDESADGFTADNAELALCAKMNLDIFMQQNPGACSHPIFQIGMMQLAALVARLEGEDA